MSFRIDADLTLAALERAIRGRQPTPGLIHHSDHGVQYASTRYVDRLEQSGAQISMAAVGNVYENALAESFFATLKREEVYLHDYQSFAEAAANLERFLEDVYNHKRLHSSLGYRPPSEFEALWHDERDDDDVLEERRPSLWFWSGVRGAPHLRPRYPATLPPSSSGNLIWNLAPMSGLGSALSVPPWALTMRPAR